MIILPVAGRWQAVPTLAVPGLAARDIMGYTFAMSLVCVPAVLVLVTLLAPHLAS